MTKASHARCDECSSLMTHCHEMYCLLGVIDVISFWYRRTMTLHCIVTSMTRQLDDSFSRIALRLWCHRDSCRVVLMLTLEMWHDPSVSCVVVSYGWHTLRRLLEPLWHSVVSYSGQRHTHAAVTSKTQGTCLLHFVWCCVVSYRQLLLHRVVSYWGHRHKAALVLHLISTTGTSRS